MGDSFRSGSGNFSFSDSDKGEANDHPDDDGDVANDEADWEIP